MLDKRSNVVFTYRGYGTVCRLQSRRYNFLKGDAVLPKRLPQSMFIAVLTVFMRWDQATAQCIFHLDWGVRRSITELGTDNTPRLNVER